MFTDDEWVQNEEYDKLRMKCIQQGMFADVEWVYIW